MKRHGVQEVKVKYLPESGTLNQEQTDFGPVFERDKTREDERIKENQKPEIQDKIDPRSLSHVVSLIK